VGWNANPSIALFRDVQRSSHAPTKGIHPICAQAGPNIREDSYERDSQLFHGGFRQAIGDDVMGDLNPGRHSKRRAAGLTTVTTGLRADGVKARYEWREDLQYAREWQLDRWIEAEKIRDIQAVLTDFRREGFVSWALSTGNIDKYLDASSDTAVDVSPLRMWHTRP
jgi:hypothetical protein